MLQNREQVFERIINNIDRFIGKSDEDFDSICQYLFNSETFANKNEIECETALDMFENDPEIDWGINTAKHKGVWAALAVIRECEETEYGEINTDLTNPVDVSNMIDYIRGNTVFADAMNKSGLDWADEPTAENIAKFKEALTNGR